MIDLYLNVNKNEITFNKGDYLLRAAERLGISDHVMRYDPNVGSVDYVLNIEPYDALVHGNRWTGIWEIDVMFDRQEMSVDKWIHSDMVFVANNNIPGRMDIFQGNRLTMFQACDPVLHRRIPEIYQDYDFVFSGSNGLEVYRERERTINLLRNSEFSFCDFGKDHVPEEYVKCLNRARIQFCRSAAKPPFIGQVEQRFFECLAIGPVLKDYHPDLEHLGLVEGEDFLWYKDDEEMIRKMKMLKKDPVMAQRIAENGRRKALLYHTYDNRLMSIINFANEYSRKPAQ